MGAGAGRDVLRATRVGALDRFDRDRWSGRNGMAALTMGAVLFVVIARPPWREVRRPDVPVVLGLGVATALVTILFLAGVTAPPKPDRQ